MTEREDFTFFYEHRVRWAEVDAQAIVFNANYFVFVDYAVTEYFRAIDMVWDRTIELGFDFFTAKAACDFRAPAIMDDIIEIGFRCKRFGNSSVEYAFGIFRGDELLAEGAMIYVCADVETRRPIPLPEIYKERIMAFEKHEIQTKQAA